MQRERKLSREYHADSVTVTFPSGETATVRASDFPGDVQAIALYRGLANRLCQGVETLADFDANVAQLKSGIWADKSKGASPVTQVIAAYVQLAEEQGKKLTHKGATAMVKGKLAEDPSFAERKMAEEKFQSAFARSQVKASDADSLDDIG